jgi:hypothetical protein
MKKILVLLIFSSLYLNSFSQNDSIKGKKINFTRFFLENGVSQFNSTNVLNNSEKNSFYTWGAGASIGNSQKDNIWFYFKFKGINQSINYLTDTIINSRTETTERKEKIAIHDFSIGLDLLLCRNNFVDLRGNFGFNTSKIDHKIDNLNLVSSGLKSGLEMGAKIEIKTINYIKLFFAYNYIYRSFENLNSQNFTFGISLK